MKEMSWVDHLGELRKRLIKVLIVFVVALTIGVAFADRIILFLKNTEPASGMLWNVFSPWDNLRLYMNVAMALAVVITSPFALYQLWGFVKPGLKPIEQRAALLYVPGAFLLSLLGIAFGYFVVFPLAVYFTTAISERLDLEQTYGAVQYLSFMLNILLPLALLFQMPMVIMFLTKLRMLNPKVLHKFRRYAYFILFVVSALITPPDLISAIIVTLPMIVLYELSVFLSRHVYRKQQKG